jgi:hypothetical protein
MHFATVWGRGVLLVCIMCSVLYSETALSRKPFGIGHVYIYTFMLRMTDAMICQNTDLSVWDILYKTRSLTCLLSNTVNIKLVKVCQVWGSGKRRGCGGGSIPGRDKIFFYSAQRPERLSGPSSFQWVLGGYFSWCKAAWRVADHVPPHMSSIRKCGVTPPNYYTSWRDA